jgi:hypothetical protein
LVGGGYRRRRCSLTRLSSTVRATVTILGPVDKQPGKVSGGLLGSPERFGVPRLCAAATHRIEV